MALMAKAVAVMAKAVATDIVHHAKTGRSNIDASALQQQATTRVTMKTKLLVIPLVT